MNRYSVTYYYLATGMEGVAATRDFGIIEANTAEEAKEKALAKINPEVRKWVSNCLEIKKFKDTTDLMVELLQKLEWSSYNQAENREMVSCCPSCDGINPNDSGASHFIKEVIGHRPNCELVRGIKNDKL